MEHCFNRFVSGHDFSRAEMGKNEFGLQPLLIFFFAK